MAILESLWGMDMLAGEGRLSARMELTPFGRAFASRVHPDCYDPDLPARLRLWGDAGLEASQKAIDRYLRSFFGRQRRFVR